MGSLTLTPAFDADTFQYAATTTNATNTVTATGNGTVALRLNGADMPGASATWVKGINTLEVIVSDSVGSVTYTIKVTK